MIYNVEGIDGLIVHFIANDVVNAEAKGPNEMFEAMQSPDVGLERRRFVTGKEDLMTAFSGNWGMPYKFVASGDSKPFEDAPWPINETRLRLNFTADHCLQENFRVEDEFNELLAFGYFDGQNIKYHDDGEHGLGDTVSTLSLGAPAEMSFRVKAKHFSGVSKTGYFTDRMPLPCTKQYQLRKAAYERLTQESFPDGGRNKRLLAIAKELGLRDNCSDRKPLITLRLNHGDVVMMHGSQVQEYLEHQVDPQGGLRFALTCRTILPDHLKPDELPTYEVKRAKGFYDGSNIADMKGLVRTEKHPSQWSAQFGPFVSRSDFAGWPYYR